MRLQLFESILQVLLISSSGSLFFSDATTLILANATVPVTTTNIDLIDVASKISVVAILIIGIVIINKERNSLLDKMHSAYKVLLDEKDKIIKDKDDEVKFWREKALEKN